MWRSADILCLLSVALCTVEMCHAYLKSVTGGHRSQIYHVVFAGVSLFSIPVSNVFWTAPASDGWLVCWCCLAVPCQQGLLNVRCAATVIVEGGGLAQAMQSCICLLKFETKNDLASSLQKNLKCQYKGTSCAPQALKPLKG